MIAEKRRPFTGAEYIQSLRDGREVYIDGERVADVTSHPAFRNAVRSIAALYDALHDPKSKAELTCPTDTGSGGYTHKYFRVARSRDDMLEAHSRRSPDGRGCPTAGWAEHRITRRRFPILWAVFPEYYGPYADNAADLVQARAGSRAVHEPRHCQSTHRPPQTGGSR